MGERSASSPAPFGDSIPQIPSSPSAARSVLPHAAIVQFGIRRHERLNMDKQDGEDRGLKLEYKRFTKSKDFKQG